MNARTRYVSTLVLIALTGKIIAQTVNVPLPKPEFKKWQFGISFSPDYCFRTLLTDNSSTSETVKLVRNDGERPKLGYTGGLSIVYNFSKTIGLETGLLFSNKGYKYENSDLTFGDMIDPRRGFVYSSADINIKSVKFIYSFYYIDVPLKVNFVFGKRNIRFITSVGVTTNVFLDERFTSVRYYQDGSKERNSSATNDDYNRINLSPQLGAGIDWKLNSKNNLRIEPTLRYGIMKINDDSVMGYLWNFGLNVNFLFGKSN